MREAAGIKKLRDVLYRGHSSQPMVVTWQAAHRRVSRDMGQACGLQAVCGQASWDLQHISETEGQ